jgi:hypothetical protein
MSVLARLPRHSGWPRTNRIERLFNKYSKSICTHICLIRGPVEFLNDRSEFTWSQSSILSAARARRDTNQSSLSVRRVCKSKGEFALETWNSFCLKKAQTRFRVRPWHRHLLCVIVAWKFSAIWASWASLFLYCHHSVHRGRRSRHL